MVLVVYQLQLLVVNSKLKPHVLKIHHYNHVYGIIMHVCNIIVVHHCHNHQFQHVN
jgi:hypothetical protein